VIPASIIEELWILERLKIESEGKKVSIALSDDTPTGNPILDGIMFEIINIQKAGKTLKLVEFLKGFKW